MMEALILSCGGTINPLIKSIIKYKSDLIYFLHSEDSFANVMEILSIFKVLEELKLFDFHLNCKFKLIKEYQDIEKVFSVSNEIITELHDESYDIRIDFTGGTKPMSAGLILASIGKNCKYSYIGTENEQGREKKGLGQVKDGFELAIEQNDPYESYAIFEFNKGKTFFDEYQFKAAKSNFEDAIKKSKSEHLKKLAKIYLAIVESYDLWDKFAIKKSKNVMLFKPLKYVLKEINGDEYANSHFSKKYPHFIRQIEENINFLEMKISDNKRKRVNEKNINYYLPDLLNNAQRRIDEGKYDDAVARLYRAIELIAQIQLTREGLIDLDRIPDKVFKIKKSEIHNLPQDLPIKDDVMSWYEFTKSPEEDVFKIGLCKSYLLLKGLGCDFAERYIEDKNTQNNINLRNGSILAHGLERIKKAKADELMQQVLKYAEEICPNIHELKQQAKFPKFQEEKC